jgi:hypothetical protein
MECFAWYHTFCLFVFLLLLVSTGELRNEFPLDPLSGRSLNIGVTFL